MLKKSMYTKLFRRGNTVLAFNSLTCCLVQLDEKVLSIIENNDFENQDTEIINNLHEAGFIVDSSIDELKKIEILNNMGKFGKSNVWMITIAPTLACNFSCEYCFEESKNIFMGRDVEEGILELISSNIENYDILEVCWFGGEPTLAYDNIVRLSKKIIEICKDNNKEYKASMISNGYLLDSKRIEELKILHIDQIQITIDGMEQTHNERRKLKNSSTGTFERIVTNVKELSKYMTVSVRINIDKRNIDEAERVVDLFSEIENKSNIFLNLGLVFKSPNMCKSLLCKIYTIEEYSVLKIKFQKYLVSKGFIAQSQDKSPKVILNNCMADHLDSMLIGPSGEVYKCTNFVGMKEYVVGNVLSHESILDIQTRGSKYLFLSPLSNLNCKKCDILPLCMGGCPNKLSEKKNKCNDIKYTLEHQLWQYYDSELSS